MTKIISMMWLALMAILTVTTLSGCSDDDNALTDDQKAEIILANRLKTNYWVNVEDNTCKLLRFTDDKCYYENISLSSYENLSGAYSVEGNVVTISFEDANGPFKITCSLDGRELVATSKYGTTLFLHDTLNESKIFELEGNGYGLTKHYDYVSGKAGNSFVLPKEMNPTGQDDLKVTIEQFKDNLGFNLNMLFENISFEDGKMVLIHNMLDEVLKCEFTCKVIQEDGKGFWEGTKRSRLELQMPIGGSTKTVYGNMLKSKGQLLVIFDNGNSRDFYSAVWLAVVQQRTKKKFSDNDVATYKKSFDEAFDNFILTLVLGENNRIAEAKTRYELAQNAWTYLDKETNSFTLLHFGAHKMSAIKMTGDGAKEYIGAYDISDGMLTSRLTSLKTGERMLVVGKLKVEGDKLYINGKDGEKVLEKTVFSLIDDFDKYRYTFNRFYNSIKLNSDKVMIENHPQLIIDNNPVIDVRKLADNYIDNMEDLSFEVWFEDGKINFAVELAGETMEFSKYYEVSESEMGAKVLTMTDDSMNIPFKTHCVIAAYKDKLILSYMTEMVVDVLVNNYLGELYMKTGYAGTNDDLEYLRTLIGGAIQSSMVSYVLTKK